MSFRGHFDQEHFGYRYNPPKWSSPPPTDRFYLESQPGQQGQGGPRSFQETGPIPERQSEILLRRSYGMGRGGEWLLSPVESSQPGVIKKVDEEAVRRRGDPVHHADAVIRGTSAGTAAVYPHFERDRTQKVGQCDVGDTKQSAVFSQQEMSLPNQHQHHQYQLPQPQPQPQPQTHIHIIPLQTENAATTPNPVIPRDTLFLWGEVFERFAHGKEATAAAVGQGIFSSAFSSPPLPVTLATQQQQQQQQQQQRHAGGGYGAGVRALDREGFLKAALLCVYFEVSDVALLDGAFCSWSDVPRGGLMSARGFVGACTVLYEQSRVHRR